MEIDENRFQGTKLDEVLQNFLKIASTGIHLCVYASPAYYDTIKTATMHYRNVTMMECLRLEDTWTSGIVKNTANLRLPVVRTAGHDTADFFTLMNSKLEFVKKAMDVTDGTHYAWVDFRISHVFKDDDTSLSYLSMLGRSALAPQFMATPGCWAPGVYYERIHIHVSWRFCGGFIMGDRGSLDALWELHLAHYPRFLETLRMHLWEVNYWAWLEHETGWNSGWYAADHDDSIIRIPSHYYSDVCGELESELESTILTYMSDVSYMSLKFPTMSGYEPMSAAYICHRGVNMLNVRYVNYRLTDVGSYMINHVAGHLQTQNRMCILDEGMDLYTSAIVRNDVGLPTYSATIHGAEDIRLFEWKGMVHCIFTQREWSPCGRNRMMLAVYDVAEPCIRDAVLLAPPTDTGCEKNWIPYVGDDGVLRIIYGWNPYRVGTIDTNGSLVLTRTHYVGGICRKLKGSTVPVKYDGGLWCIAHYSVESAPRIYVHVMVRLDPETLLPTHFSRPFSFRRVGIEYCIGFCVRNSVAHCWISEHDREPGLVCAPMSAFEMLPAD